MADATKCQRLIALRDRLWDGGQVSVPDIVDRYGVTRRTATRDLDDLRDMGMDLEAEVAMSGIQYWKLPTRSRNIQVRYSLLDVMSLFMGRRFFDFLENTSLEDSFNRVYKRIEERLDVAKDLDNARKLRKKVYLVHEGPKKLPSRAREILDTCLDGLIREDKLSIQYRTSKKEQRNYTAHPYTLVAYKRGLYLVAHVEEINRELVLSLERIEAAKWLKKVRFKYPKEFDPERYFEKAMFIMPGEPEPVVLVFTSSTEPFIRIRRFHKTQKLTHLDGGKLKMTLKAPINDELVNWIASFREHVEVIEPEELRKRIAASLKSALAQYQ